MSSCFLHSFVAFSLGGAVFAQNAMNLFAEITADLNR